MKKQLILSLALMVTLFSFAQKKELKKLEKAIKNNNYSEAKAMVSQLEPMLGSMDDKMKSKFYFASAKAFYANGTGAPADLQKALDNFNKVDGKYVSEFAETKQVIKNEFLTKANAAYSSKNFVEAANLFSILYEIDSADQEYLYFAAISAISGQDYDLALNFYKELNKIGYDGVKTEYYATNKESGKEEVFAKNVRDLYVNKTKTHINPGERQTESKKAEITKNIALIYLNQGKKEEALAAIKDAREADPEDVNLIVTEANTQYQLGNVDAYAKLIKEAVDKDPNNVDLLYNLGVLSAETGKNEEARAYYEKTLAIDPNYVNALTNMASLVLSDEQAIIEEMNGLGSSAKDDKRYDELKGQRLEVYKRAVPYLEKVLSISDNNIEAAKTLVNIYIAIDEGAKAKELKEKYGI
ncbi:tetratricopeptide repeat protein [Lacinutrix sp. 5H-3-7-4]|uniref:tetratricopeptide repeat protein n=1 Tax=Lacinutrix sp. (strain 5H-3-7-4) TaxID=983544 RepID=UPI00020A3D95|nr:tetratricopeptide repeat protein [Lacinutrix sp. 5H-3-7-4]AEH02447.1 Tetratricopeptide TPR_2 repeat-containing protein [Lacinutrix sp. 5H-3-7-4]